MVAYRPKRGRFAGYKNSDLSQSNIRNFIDDILGGGGNYEKLQGSDLRFGGDSKRNDL